MQTAMSNGVSALLSFQKALDVESNNASNTQSTAYKGDSVSFSDLFYSNSVGLGVNMDTPRRDFSQGQLKPTNSGFDFAILGEGFFTVQHPEQPDQVFYTRAGQFSSDKNNNLVDGNGMLVLGVQPTVTGDVISSEYVENIATLIVDDGTSTSSINTYITDYAKASEITGNTGISGTNYKTADANTADIEKLIYAYENALDTYGTNPVAGDAATKAQTVVEFSLVAGENDAYTVEVVIDGVKFQENFDESVENTLRNLSDKINQYAGITTSVDTTTGEMTIESMIPGQNLVVTKAKVNNDTMRIENIVEEAGSGRALVDAIYAELQALTTAVGASVATNTSSIANPGTGANIATSPIILDLNELGMNSTLYEKLLTNDPETVASYPGIESEDGKLYLSDGDARFLVGMLVPVTFTDKSILNPVGDNLYQNTDSEVEPYHIEGMAKVYGEYLENSNVDLSKELVDILTFQKAFEANSKSISTADELMKTALALKNR